MSRTKELLGKQIQRLRKRSGLTQEALAERVGIAAPHLSRIENGSSYPSLACLDRMATEMGIDVRELFEFPDQESLEDLRNQIIDVVNGQDDTTVRAIARAVRMILAGRE